MFTSDKLVKIIIDGKDYEVPAGANLVDVAKWSANNDIPVFCYHPKMEPVGMCRMCVVELGMIEKDRETGQPLMENGQPKVRWFPKLQTACTQLVSDGMVVRTDTKKVDEARESVLEFLLTSHPLDCPICDKGGECPLQNLTMAHGPGGSRMDFSDKMKLDKHVPLGDLIYLDEERCIQCARCVRFQAELVGDDVLAFHERGRRLQIITHSDPGFDTYFSGNTTDICPVGALTTADFRFGARPWELSEVPSICPHDAAGSNISLSTRLDRDFGGRAIIKRVMPRQNEAVNEIWISDRTRFVHHFTRSSARLMQPMQRRGSALSASGWDEALRAAAKALQDAGGDVAVIAGGSASNEDLWELRQLVTGLGSTRLGAWPPTHTGAAYVAQAGVGLGSNLGRLGKGDAVLVIGADLEEEVPLWYLRLKRAQDHGVYLAVAGARPTRLEDFAAETQRGYAQVSGAVIRYELGEAASTMLHLREKHAEVAEKLAGAKNLVIVAGADLMTLDENRALMQAAAQFLSETGHVGKPNNGLLSPFPGPNGMGLHYLGYTPEATLEIAAQPPKVLILAQAEVLDDDPAAAAWLEKVETVIALSLFPDAATRQAKFALPVQSFAERDGSWTNGERRVQRFYTAQGPMGEAIPAWKAAARLRELAGQGRAKVSAAAVMLEITQQVAAYEGARYKDMAQVERQFPDVGGADLYYGGTAYQNKGGLGVQIASSADNGEEVVIGEIAVPQAPKTKKGELLLLPIPTHYNRSYTQRASEVIAPRVPAPYVVLSSKDAKKLGVLDGDAVSVSFEGGEVTVRAQVNSAAPEGAALLPRHLSEAATPLAPASARIAKVSEPVLVKA